MFGYFFVGCLIVYKCLVNWISGQLMDAWLIRVLFSIIVFLEILKMVDLDG